MRKWLFFFFFHEAGEGVGMERMLCWWLAELLLEKKQSLRLGGFEGLVCSEKTVIFALSLLVQH